MYMSPKNMDASRWRESKLLKLRMETHGQEQYLMLTGITAIFMMRHKNYITPSFSLCIAAVVSFDPYKMWYCHQK